MVRLKGAEVSESRLGLTGGSEFVGAKKVKEAGL